MDAKIELGELKRPLLESQEEMTQRYSSTSSTTDKDTEANQNSKLSSMVDKVLGHNPHSIYFVEGANALSRESGILKSALEKVGKNASKCTKKRLNDDNAQTFPSFCFYSRADDGGDIREFEEVLGERYSTEFVFVPWPNESNIKYQFMNELLKKFSGPCLKIIVGDFEEIAKLTLADSTTYFEDDRPLLICTADEEFYSTRSSLKDISKFGKELKGLCKNVGVEEARKVCSCLKENAWKVDICKFPKTKDLNAFAKDVSLAICKGSNPRLPWLMDNSQEIVNIPAQFNRESSMLVFPNMWKYEGTKKKLNLDLLEEKNRKNLPTGKMVGYSIL